MRYVSRSSKDGSKKYYKVAKDGKQTIISHEAYLKGKKRLVNKAITGISVPKIF